MDVQKQSIKESWISSVSGYEYTLYTTGSFRVSSKLQKNFFTLTNTNKLYKDGYLHKLVELIDGFSWSEFRNCKEYKTHFEFNEPVSGETLRSLLDLDLPVEDKLFSITSYLSSIPRVSKSLVLEAVSKQKRLKDIAKDEAHGYKYELSFSEYLFPDRGKLKKHFFRFNDEKFIKYCRRVGFFNNEAGVTYEEYLETLGDSFFTPIETVPKSSQGWYIEMKKLVSHKDSEYFSYESEKFALALRAHQDSVPEVLKEWSFNRYMAGIIPMKFLKKPSQKEKLESRASVDFLNRWGSLQSYLSNDEFKAFTEYVAPNKTLKSILALPSSETAHLFAVAWVEGGETGFMSLVRTLTRDLGVDSRTKLNSIVNYTWIKNEDRNFRSFHEYLTIVAKALLMDSDLSLDMKIILV